MDMPQGMEMASAHKTINTGWTGRRKSSMAPQRLKNLISISTAVLFDTLLPTIAARVSIDPITPLVLLSSCTLSSLCTLPLLALPSPDESILSLSHTSSSPVGSSPTTTLPAFTVSPLPSSTKAVSLLASALLLSTPVASLTLSTSLVTSSDLLSLSSVSDSPSSPSSSLFVHLAPSGLVPASCRRARACVSLLSRLTNFWASSLARERASSSEKWVDTNPIRYSMRMRATSSLSTIPSKLLVLLLSSA
mmetsp:Transcript_34228/g.88425  ORF Transcript_34228/g.88425 Transcript_34228/m.88425 type:complete len:249 (+) Transcript_34228:1096-1842(+)